MQWKTSLLEWWQLISEKRCDDCTHLLEDGYNEVLKAFYNKQECQKPYTSKNLTLGDEVPKVMWASFG
jgi:hypothetical protein